MKTLILTLLGLVVVSLAGWSAARLSLSRTYREAAVEVCRLVDDNYYRREDPAVRTALEECYADARAQEFFFSKAANIKRINARLSMIGSSHLAVYDPDENRMMWEHTGLDTGLRARFVEDQLIVFRVVPGSAAARADVRVGDALLSLNGDGRISPFDIQSLSGRYAIRRRGGATLTIAIQAEQLVEDLSPSLTEVSEGVGLLRIPSFLGTYFEEAKWKKMAGELSRYRSIVVDLRENAGGSFPAMVRALSPFLCDSPNIGRVFSQVPKAGADVGDVEAILNDVLDSQSQLVQLNEASSVRLRAFGTYGCFKGPVIALVDAGTSSVSEIFAQAILTRDKSDLLGSPTAGQVVMARWFPIGGLGSESYQMAIPIAGFLTPSGHELEGRGVHPHAYLEYDLARSLLGRDSWLERAQTRIKEISGNSRVSK